MGINISYMGTKRELAPIVSEVIGSTREGVLLDVFSGMCSVGEAVASSRQVWSNDAQVFAAEVAAALFTSNEEAASPTSISDLLFDRYASHRKDLAEYFSDSLEIETKLVEAKNFDDFLYLIAGFEEALSREMQSLSAENYYLFTKTYSNSYFGLSQTMSIDSIVCSIDNAFKSRQLSTDAKRFALICLGKAMLRSANSTGHFAQYLKPKAATFEVHIRQRRRNIWHEWIAALDDFSPIGDLDWRAGNKVFNSDCLELLPRLYGDDLRPSVIYADPPYTDDQYSRYYHLLETLILYDYPDVAGIGRYRSARFRTPFSIKTLSVSAMSNLVASSAKIGADLVLSYPTNGLAYSAGIEISELLRAHYPKVELCHALSHSHSTFGASKGDAKAQVVEQIFMGRL